MIEINPNWIPMTCAEQKAVMLNEMLVFHGFCQEHGIEYYLDAGTLLGSVRHKGFIPWDDDVDLGLPRESYDRLHKLAKENRGYIAPHLRLQPATQILYPSSKASDDRTVLIEFPDRNPMECSVYMDVFPQDGVVDDGFGARFFCKRMEWCGLLQWFCKYSVDAWKGSGNPVRRLASAVGGRIVKGSNIAPRLQDKAIRRHNMRHPLNECMYFTTLVNGEFAKRAPVRCIEKFIDVDFEGFQFKIPVGYDEYLRRLYPGDYMELPPEDKRVWHNTKIYWVDQAAKEDFYAECAEVVKLMQEKYGDGVRP